MSLRSSFGFTHEATASQKNIKSCSREEGWDKKKRKKKEFQFVDSTWSAVSIAGPHLHNTSWVYTDHSANASECRVFLLIVSYISQRCAPGERNKQIYHQRNGWNILRKINGTTNTVLSTWSLKKIYIYIYGYIICLLLTLIFNVCEEKMCLSWTETLRNNWSMHIKQVEIKSTRDNWRSCHYATDYEWLLY